VAAVDGLLQLQASADAVYFTESIARKVDAAEAGRLREALLHAYRWQYIVSGVRNERFMKILSGMVTEEQMGRIAAALGPIMGAAAAS